MDFRELSFTAIDFETASSNRHSICQIGICRVEYGKVTSTESILVQPPGNDFSHWNIAVHGISPDRTKNQPIFPDVWKKIHSYFNESLIVAHNAVFDLDCLNRTLDFYNIPIPDVKYECTYQLTQMNLIDLSESLDIEIRNHHKALDDAIMCAHSYIKLKQGVKPDLNKVSVKAVKGLFANHERLSGKILKPDLENVNIDSPFYKKKCVFTGVLSEITRGDAANIIKRMGADIDTSITKRTSFVIIGEGAGPSKLKKIDEYNLNGSSIVMLYEEDFLEMIQCYR
jgi:DNA polymerase-3 subunit epsilon